MQSKKDYSYGVIPVRQNEAGEWEFFLIHQWSSVKGHHYWIFPKGHVEAGEEPTETAIRELREETGFEVDLQTEQTFSLFYDFTVDDVLINKEAVFYIGIVTKDEFKPQDGEVSDGKWLTYDAARAQLTHENAQELLDQTQQELATLK